MKLLLISSILCIFVIKAHGQIENKQLLKQAYQRLDSVDTRNIKSGLFLNRGFFLGQHSGIAQRLGLDDNTRNTFFINQSEVSALFRGILKSSTENTEPILDFDQSLNGFKKDGVIPVGVVFTEGEWLQDYEIKENVDARSKGYHLNKVYKQQIVRGAGIFFEKLYTKVAVFQVPAYFFKVDEEVVKSVQIDFGDGKGYLDLKPDKQYVVEYIGDGEKSIAINVKADDRDFVFYSKLVVEDSDFEQPDLVFEIGSKEVQEDAFANMRIEGLGGGTAVLYNGCDRIFDKPVIIVEGFDPINQRNIYPNEETWQQQRAFSATIRGNYRSYIEPILRNNGYDVIYLNFNNGGASIRNNAQVLEQLISDVKQRKVGSQGITIIGESMGGLVARYSLKSMENRNIFHSVNKFISFDSPHLGANVPVGYQTFLDDLNDVDILNLFNIGNAVINEGVAYLNSTAAKQMLLRYRGPNPHAEFTSLQQEFQQMGFPNQNGIKNIAIINGSLSGFAQSPVSNFNPGDKLLEIDAITGIFNLNLDLRTNNLNSSTKVSSIWLHTSGVPTTIKDRTFQFSDFNFDIATGGYETNGLGQIGIDTKNEWFNNIVNSFIGNIITTYGRDQFSFVPLFSSVASTAPKNSQLDLNRPISQIVANNWTPFQAIYANSENTRHARVFPLNTQWTSLLNSEFGISQLSFSCQTSPGTMAPPPTPFFNTTFWYKCPDERRTFTIDGASAISNLYYHVWEITGPNGYFTTVHGDQLTVGYLPPGAYTITLLRNYAGGAYSNFTTLHSRVLNVFPASDPVFCNSGGGGDPVPRLLGTEDNIRVSDQVSKIIEDESVVFWPNPTSGKLNLAFNLNEPGFLMVSVYPASNSHSEGIILTDSWRPAGKFEETFRLDHLRKGLYLIQIQTESQVVIRRLIVN